MNRSQRKSVVAGFALFLGGLLFAQFAPVAVVLPVVDGPDSLTPENMAAQFEAISRAGKLATQLAVGGLAVSLGGLFYALGTLAMWFIGPAERKGDVT